MPGAFGNVVSSRPFCVQPGEVLEEVPRVRGDEVGVLRAVEPRVLLLEHVGARRARHHDLAALAAPLPRGVLTLSAMSALGLRHRAPVEVRHPAAALGGQRHVHAVLLEHRDRGLAGGGVVVLHRAGGEEGHAVARRRRSARRAPCRWSNQRENVSRWKGGRLRRCVDADHRLHERAVHRDTAFIQFESGAVRLPERADQLGVAEEAILQGHALARAPPPSARAA